MVYPLYFTIISGCYGSSNSHQYFVYPHLEFQPFYLLWNSLLWSRSSFSKWIIISVDYFNARAPSDTTPEDHWETSADTPCGSLLAHLCSKGITLRCASQSVLSVHFRMQVKMVIFDLQNWEWIGLHWLKSKLLLDVVK